MGLETVLRRLALVGGLVGAGVGTAPMLETSAYAQQRMTIEEFYKQSRPADDILPGARVMPYQVSRQVDGEGTLLRGNEFTKLYFDDPDYSGPLQGIFRNLHGQRIYNPATGNYDTFDFQRFNTLMWENKDALSGLFIYTSGYFQFHLKDRKLNITVPIPESTAQTLIDL